MQVEEKPKIVIILGPTAVGKTDLALDLASAFEGEIISADSMQVYRHLDIGTSKPTRRKSGMRVPHHLIDIVNPDEEFNAALFNGMADGVIGKLQGGKSIFVVGGTGLYIRALTGGIIEGPGPDETLRKNYRRALEKEDKGEPLRPFTEAGSRRRPGGFTPTTRSGSFGPLRSAELAGEPISEKQRRHGFRQVRYECLKVGLYRDRGELYRRIDSRASQMIEAGLVEETEKILCMGYNHKMKPLQSLGYRYIIRYIRNELTLEEALRSMQRDTRHYARRQMTWFRGEGDIEWFHPDETGPISVADRQVPAWSVKRACHRRPRALIP